MQKPDMLSQFKTRMQVEKRERALPSTPTTQASLEVASCVRTVKQEDGAGMDKLAKRRAALKKLHDFKDGVL